MFLLVPNAPCDTNHSYRRWAKPLVPGFEIRIPSPRIVLVCEQENMPEEYRDSVIVPILKEKLTSIIVGLVEASR